MRRWTGPARELRGPLLQRDHVPSRSMDVGDDGGDDDDRGVNSGGGDCDDDDGTTGPGWMAGGGGGGGGGCCGTAANSLFVLGLAVLCAVQVKLHRCGNELNLLCGGTETGEKWVGYSVGLHNILQASRTGAVLRMVKSSSLTHICTRARVFRPENRATRNNPVVHTG